MKISTQTAGSSLSRSPLLVAFACDRRTPELGAAMTDFVARAKKTGDLSSTARKTSLFHRAEGAKGEPARLGFVGIGKESGIHSEALRRAAAVAQGLAERVGVASFDLVVDAKDCGKVSAFDAGIAIAEGLALGAYRYEPPKKVKAKPRKGQAAVVRYQGGKKADFERGLKLGQVGAAGTIFARDIENRGGNLATPSILAAEAKKLHGAKVKVKVLDKKDMERAKMMAMLGVSRGSVEAPKLIVMDYNPAGAKKTVCVVGKGVTFDSGGISLKPGAKMDEMRYDMCGAGAVLGLFHALAKGGMTGAKGKVRIIGIAAAVENMPDATAQKPGDIVRACDGTTIEILNTDAEGRLVLADALAWAKKTYKPDQMVDLATLTGAVIVALGHEVAGIMGNDEGLIADLRAAGDEADEPLWPLPLWQLHKDQIKSKFADIANLNGAQYGNGTIAGAAFLWNFVGDTKWAHIDIAGTAWGGRAKDYYKGGAAGTAVRTLLNWVRGLK